MLKKINDFYKYCRVNHPLLWNTRLPWMLVALLITHALFFMGGFLTLTIKRLHLVSEPRSTADFGIYTFSILCSTTFMVVWLVLFLRNNAFKSYYHLGRHYLTQQFIYIFIIVFGSISFFESYNLGGLIRFRQLLPQSTLVKEVNILNRGISFVPLDRNNYFILNKCNDSTFYEVAAHYFAYSPEQRDSVYKSSIRPEDSREREILGALNDSNAISFENYCRDEFELTGYSGFVPAIERYDSRVTWLSAQNRDSITLAIQELLNLFDKYGLRHRFKADSIAEKNFTDETLHQLVKFRTVGYGNYDEDFASTYRDYPESAPFVHFNYLLSELRGIYMDADSVYLDVHGRGSSIGWVVLLYFAISFSMLIFTYRLFTRKVLLWSIVSSLIILIFLTLFTVGSNKIDAAFLITYAFVLVVYLATFSDPSGTKLASGVSLMLLFWALPFLIFCIISIAEDTLYSYRVDIFMDTKMREQILAERHPIAYWISRNQSFLVKTNLLIVFLLSAFLLPRLARRWRAHAEE